MYYKVWDKKEEINGVSADCVIKSHNINYEDEIFLIINEKGKVIEIQFKNIIEDCYDLDSSFTCEQVAQEYIRIKEDEKLQAEKEQISLEEQQNKISILESENKALREELTQIQTSIASLTSLITATLEEK